MITDNFNMYRVEVENIKHFQPKKNLSNFEKYGLANALQDFIKEWELDNYGESYTDIHQYIRYNESNVDILDGYYDTYIFNNYAINNIYITNDGIIMLSCYEVQANEYGEFLPENIDYNTQIVFRLN